MSILPSLAEIAMTIHDMNSHNSMYTGAEIAMFGRHPLLRMGSSLARTASSSVGISIVGLTDHAIVGGRF